MRLSWLLVAGAGLVVLALSILKAREPSIGPAERRVFHAINGWPGWLYPILWLPMQLGNLVVGTVAGLVVARVYRDLGVAVGVGVAVTMNLVTERVVRKEMAGALAIRQRPGTSQVGAVRRGGDVPMAGPSFIQQFGGDLGPDAIDHRGDVVVGRAKIDTDASSGVEV